MCSLGGHAVNSSEAVLPMDASFFKRPILLCVCAVLYLNQVLFLL